MYIVSASPEILFFSSRGEEIMILRRSGKIFVHILTGAYLHTDPAMPGERGADEVYVWDPMTSP